MRKRESRREEGGRKSRRKEGRAEERTSLLSLPLAPPPNMSWGTSDLSKPSGC